MFTQTMYSAREQSVTNQAWLRAVVTLAIATLIYGCIPRPTFVAPTWQVDPRSSVIVGADSVAWDYAPVGKIEKRNFAMDAAGNVYVGGFNPTTPKPSNLTTLEGNATYTLARYSTDGQLEWSKDVISTPIHFPTSARTNKDWYTFTRNINIDLDAAGNVYVLTPYVTDKNLANAHWYLAKYDALGTLIWETYRSTPTPSIELPVNLQISDDDSLYIHAARVNNSTSIDSLIVSYDVNGLERWIRSGQRFTELTSTTNQSSITSYIQFMFSAISTHGVDVYTHYYSASVDTTTNELVGAWKLEKIDGQSAALAWQFSDPDSREEMDTIVYQETDYYLKRHISTAGISILDGDTAGNLLVQRGGSKQGFMEPMSVQKFSSTGTVLWRFDSAYPFFATTDEFGNLYALELPDGEVHFAPTKFPWSTVFTHINPDGKKQFSKYIPMSQTIKSKALISTSMIQGIFRDTANRFYINSNNLHCTLNCGAASNGWTEMIVLDASATELGRTSLGGHNTFSYHLLFDPSNNLVITNGDSIAKYAINTLLSATAP